jgi:hypothetical protein
MMQRNTSQKVLADVLAIWEKGQLGPWVVLEVIWASMGDGSITGAEISGEADRYAKLWLHLEEIDQPNSTYRCGVDSPPTMHCELARLRQLSAAPPTTSMDQSDWPDDGRPSPW